MNTQAVQLSYSLEAVGRAIARFTLEALASADPSIAERYGERWREDWLANLESRLAYLAQALALRRPEVFAQTMVWSRDGAAARGGRVEDLDTSLAHMATVMEAELPPPLARAALECVTAARSALAAAPPADASDSLGPGNGLARDYVEKLLAGQADEAVELVLEHARAGASLTDVYARVVHPAQVEIGQRWHRNDITVAEEHYATAATQTLVARLRQFTPRVTPNGRHVIAAAVAGDFHDLGIRMVADTLELDGWRVTYLGANLPAAEVARLVSQGGTHLLALSAHTFLHLRTLAETIDEVRGAPRAADVRILVGGPPFQRLADLWRDVGADGFAETAAQAAGVARQLVSAKP